MVREGEERTDRRFPANRGPLAEDPRQVQERRFEADSNVISTEHREHGDGTVSKTYTIESTCDDWLEVWFEQPLAKHAATDPWFYDRFWFRSGGFLESSWEFPTTEQPTARFVTPVPPGGTVSAQVDVTESSYLLPKIENMTAAETDLGRDDLRTVEDELTARRRGLQLSRATRRRNDGGLGVEFRVQATRDGPVSFTLVDKHDPGLDLGSSFAVVDDEYADGWSSHPEYATVAYEGTVRPDEPVYPKYVVENTDRAPGRTFVPRVDVPSSDDQSGEDSTVRTVDRFDAVHHGLELQKTVVEPTDPQVDRRLVVYDVSSRRDDETTITVTEDLSGAGVDLPTRLSFPDGAEDWSLDDDGTLKYERRLASGGTVRTSYRLERPQGTATPPEMVFVG